MFYNIRKVLATYIYTRAIKYMYGELSTSKGLKCVIYSDWCVAVLSVMEMVWISMQLKEHLLTNVSTVSVEPL